jgi:hypothetical protein
MMSSSVGPTCQCILNRYARLGFGGFSGWAAVVGFGPGKLLSLFSVLILFQFMFTILNSLLIFESVFAGI